LLVKYFILSDFADIKPVIDSLREGYTIAIVKYKPLGNKDSTELKRAISKIKRTIEAINGELMGMEDGWLVAVPQFFKLKSRCIREQEIHKMQKVIKALMRKLINNEKEKISFFNYWRRWFSWL